MNLLLSIRNLLRSWKTSLLLFLLLSLLSASYILGSSLLERSGKELEAGFTQGLTADLLIQPKIEHSLSLFGANTPIIGDFITIPSLTAPQEILQQLEGIEEISGYSPLLSVQGLMEAGGKKRPAVFFGIDPQRYFQLFPGIELEAGRFLRPGEEGLMLPHNLSESLDIEPGELLKLYTTGRGSFRIRELPVLGTYRYPYPVSYDKALLLIDPQSARSLSKVYRSASSSTVEDEEAALLDQDSEALFATNSEEEEAEGGLELDAFTGLFEERTDTSYGAWREGDWSFILLRLKPGASASSLQQLLEEELSSFHVRIVGWRQAAGNSALLVLLLQSLFDMGMGLVALAAATAMVNILLISVFRRTRELGTLRALGAPDSYIRRMIYSENLFLALLSLGGGLLLSLGLASAINACSLPLGNELLASFLGSKTLSLRVEPAAVRQAGIFLFLFTLTASLYPVEKAVRIDPIVAVREG